MDRTVMGLSALSALLLLGIILMAVFMPSGSKVSPGSIVKVMNVVESHGFPNGVGWVVNDGYPAPMQLLWPKGTPPDWIKSLKFGNKLIISTEKPKSGPYIDYDISSNNLGVIAWMSLGSGQAAMDQLNSCCVKDNKLDVGTLCSTFCKASARSTPMIEAGFQYGLVNGLNTTNVSVLQFWLGGLDTDKPPIAKGGKMYVFKA